MILENVVLYISNKLIPINNNNNNANKVTNLPYKVKKIFAYINKVLSPMTGATNLTARVTKVSVNSA